MEAVRKSVAELIPYENNPRLNDYAVEPVMESIRQCGYIAPIIIDEDRVVLAGHTRLLAVKRLGFTDVDCVVVPGLTDEQKRKFRILDNKTNEAAKWDTELLAGELEGLDLGDIHWFDDIANSAVEDMVKEATREKSDKQEKEDDGTIICPRCHAVINAEIGVSEGDGEEEITWSDEE